MSDNLLKQNEDTKEIIVRTGTKMQGFDAADVRISHPLLMRKLVRGKTESILSITFLMLCTSELFCFE